MSDETEQSPETRIRESGTRARKWLLGIVVAAVAAVITSYVTGGITSGVDRARGLVEDEPAPLTADVSRPFKRGSGHFVFTRPLGAVKALPLPTGELGDLEVWGAWAREHGGLESDKTGVEVVVTGTTPQPVALDRNHRRRRRTSARAPRRQRRAVRRRPGDRAPLPGQPRRGPADGLVRGVRGGAPAVDFPYRVSDTELEVFHIVAYTSGCDCLWRANLQWSYRGKSGITVIDDDGKPFRTVGRPSPFSTTPSSTEAERDISGRLRA